MKIRSFAAVVLLALVVPAALVAGRVEVDNRLERWTGSDPIERKIYEDFKRRFGNDEFVLVLLWDAPLFAADALDTMILAAEAIEAVPGIVRVQGLPVVFRDLFGAEDVEALREEMLSAPLYRNLFISEDGRTAALVVDVDPPEDLGSRRRIMLGIREAAKPLEEVGFTTGFVGSTALIDALDRTSERESRHALALALICSLLALAVFSRSLRAMMAAAACAASSVVLTIALVILTGHTLNMITSVLPALLWVLGLAGVVHLVKRFRHYRVGHEADEAVRRALGDTTRPMVLAAATTAAGFLSLLVTEMEPVRELGLFAAAGMLISLAVNLLAGPVLLRWLRVPPAAAAGSSEILERWLHVGISRPRTVIAVALVLVLSAAAGLPFIRVASNPLAFLAEDHPTVSDYRRVATTLGGFYTLEVGLELPGPWTDPAVWPALTRIADDLDGSSMVARVISPLDLLRQLNLWRHGDGADSRGLPRSREDADDLLDTLDDDGREMLAGLVSDGGTSIRLSAIVNEMDEVLFLDLVEQTRQALAGLPPGFSGKVTGQVLQLANAQQTLVASQLGSLGLALLVVFIVMGIGLRSGPLLALSVLPNLAPLLAAFALMAVADIALDAATVMVASVALGIAVDDTVHLMVAIVCGERRSSGAARLRDALDHVGPALVLTTVAACLGFFSLMTSAFVPIRSFGLLSGVAMLVALAADLWLVPALLTVFAREGATA